ncbi:MAG: glycosyl hydrolase [Sedimentisphaerales bacterium]|nr:glycosyl hydrolase [Sedimentisphaerales bacterium]
MGRSWSGSTSNRSWLALVAILGLVIPICQATDLVSGWEDPPVQARLRAFWWWLNGNVTKEAITSDLLAMKEKGFGGGLIVDAGGADQRGNRPIPPGPTFASEQWQQLFRYAIEGANRLDLEMGLSIVSGWNIGGPMVRPADAVKKLTWSQVQLNGPGQVKVILPQPAKKDGFYQDLYVLAWRIRPDLPADRRPLRNLEVKALRARPNFPGPDGWFLANSAPPTIPLFYDQEESIPGEQDANATDIVDISRYLDQDGTLRWEVPAGNWQVLRLGCTLADACRVSTHSDGWSGYALDVLDRDAFARYWQQVVEPLIAQAGPYAGKTLRYLHTDSWEIDVFNWTQTLVEEFRKRRGYDPVPYLPVIAGFIIDSRDISNRFLFDFRKTLGDLAVDNHYALFKQWAAEHGMQIHPESGGPHFTPIDAQRTLGLNDIPMSEFWAISPTHRTSEQVRFFVKQPASAAHTYGHILVGAEGFTTVGPHWQETLWDNLKPSFDYALTEGLNLLFWHAWVCSPREFGLPGIQYFAGTHLNPNVTWWPLSKPFFDYINRCQWMLQQGRFVADVLYYYGGHVPNYAQLRSSDPAGVGPGYDYDVITEEALLTRVQVKDGRLVLPDGTDYRLLVLPPVRSISLEVMRKVWQLVEDGATIIGTRPDAANGLTGYPQADIEVQRLAGLLWSGRTGKGRVFDQRPAREILISDGIAPDFAYKSDPSQADIQYIHRRCGNKEIYFVSNRRREPASIVATLRAQGMAQIWDPVTGQREAATGLEVLGDGRMDVPLELHPYGSVFVVIDTSLPVPEDALRRRSYRFIQISDISPGPWTVTFDPYWGRPQPVILDRLISWTDYPDPNIRYYSGMATYTKQIDLGAGLAGRSIWLDLGTVKEIARVRLNGMDLGILWTPPFRLQIADAIRPGTNELQIDVVNFWANRVIGDANLPESQRRTKTNITALTAKTPLMPSGLIGPVVLMERLQGY